MCICDLTTKIQTLEGVVVRLAPATRENDLGRQASQEVGNLLTCRFEHRVRWCPGPMRARRVSEGVMHSLLHDCSDLRVDWSTRIVVEIDLFGFFRSRRCHSQSPTCGLIRARVSSIAIATHMPDKVIAAAVNQKPASSAPNVSAITPSDRAPMP